VGGLHVHVSYILVELDRYRCETAVSSNNGMILLVYERGVLEFCHFCHFRSKRHVLRRQIRDLHRSAAEISSFSLLGAVSRREIVYRLGATGISLMIEVIGFRIPNTTICTSTSSLQNRAPEEWIQPPPHVKVTPHVEVAGVVGVTVWELVWRLTPSAVRCRQFLIHMLEIESPN
jgi:hypothetical protein